MCKRTTSNFRREYYSIRKKIKQEQKKSSHQKEKTSGCAAGETRTRTTLRSEDFKSSAYTIPPPRLTKTMRSETELNRCERFCRPSPNRSAIGPILFSVKTVFSVYRNFARTSTKKALFNKLRVLFCLLSQRFQQRDFDDRMRMLHLLFPYRYRSDCPL